MTGARGTMKRMKIAENVREIRASKELTIRQVARASGLSAGAIRSREHGRSILDLQRKYRRGPAD